MGARVWQVGFGVSQSVGWAPHAKAAIILSCSQCVANVSFVCFYIYVCMHVCFYLFFDALPVILGEAQTTLLRMLLLNIILN